MHLHDLHPDAFAHPSDQAALATLRQVPGLDLLIKQLMASVVEEQMHLSRSLTAIKLGPHQYPSLFRMVERACTTLDVPLPEVYLNSGYTLNAWAFGYRRCTITLYQGLIDLLDDQEILTVISHEVGHIACEHMLYKSTADILTRLGGAVLGKFLGGVASLALAPIQLALLHWSRAAEYSCDRAALLVVRDPEVCASTLARLAGTSHRFHDEFDLAQLLLDADAIDTSHVSAGGILDSLRQLQSTHPDPVLRVRELHEWAHTHHYASILTGRYLRRADANHPAPPILVGISHCPACHTPIGDKTTCAHCGCRLGVACQIRCPKGHVNDSKWNFCRSCGISLNHQDKDEEIENQP